MNPENLFQAINSLQVLIIGDVMIDRYVEGKVERVSPEAPVPVVNLRSTENRLGGAANVALNIQSMGARPILCSVIGDDDNADIFETLLPKEKIETFGILRSKERCTTVKTRILAANQHLLRVDEEDTQDLSAVEQRHFIEKVKEILEKETIDVILFQDYNKGVLCIEVIRKIILEAIRRDIPTVVDPKFKNFLEYRNTTLFKPNLKEIKEALPFEVQDNLKSLTKAAEYLRSKMRNESIMITLSEKGIFLDLESWQTILPTQARNIADVCGAGDTVISIAALGIALGIELPEIAVLANLAGGQVCEKVGVVPVDKPQLLKEYKDLLTYSKT